VEKYKCPGRNMVSFRGTNVMVILSKPNTLRNRLLVLTSNGPRCLKPR